MAGTMIYTMGRAIADLYGNEINVPLEKVGSFRKYVGGSSANTAVGLARLGDSVGLIGRVGNDAMGRFIRETLQGEHVDVTMLSLDPDVSTGIAFAALSPPNDSSVWFCGVPNANARLSVGDLDFQAITSASALVIAGTIFAQEPGRSAALAMVEAVSRLGIPVALDVDWRPMFWTNPDAADAIYARVLAGSAVVLANEPELALVGHSTKLDEAARRLFDFGVTEVVAKRGAQGSWYLTPHLKLHQSSYSVAVQNTLGAGDGFAAGYIHGYVAGWNPEERLRWASACGALVVSRHSCSDAMPTHDEVVKFLASR